MPPTGPSPSAGVLFRPWVPVALFRGGRINSVRVRFRPGRVAAGFSAALGKGLGEKPALRVGGAHLRVMVGASKEATQKLGGHKSPEVVKRVYSKRVSEEVAF